MEAKIKAPFFNFGEMLEYLKQGEKMCRLGWNGKHMYISALYEDGFLPTIVMKTAQGTFLKGWLASQSDIFAEDWIFATD